MNILKNKNLNIFLLLFFVELIFLFPTNVKATELSEKLRGRILLQVEKNGEAWYVNPKDSKRYYMADGSEAYNIMRNFGVGITNKNLEKLKSDKVSSKSHQGKIFLQVENHGEAFYVDTAGVLHYLKDGAAAYEVMRKLGLGIKTADLSKISLGQDNYSESSLEFYSVVDVVDGDTIKIKKGDEIQTLRLIGVDTPEVVDPRKPVQCFGKEASSKAKELLTDKKVRIEADSTQGDVDKYNRYLRYVWLESGEFFNDKMIREGYAHEYTYAIPYKYQEQFKTAQAEAKTNERGLWSSNACSSEVDDSVTNELIEKENEKYYTSSHYSSKYYYPESCDGWEGLSKDYLKVFNSLEELLKTYSTKALSPSCL